MRRFNRMTILVEELEGLAVPEVFDEDRGPALERGPLMDLVRRKMVERGMDADGEFRLYRSFDGRIQVEQRCGV